MSRPLLVLSVVLLAPACLTACGTTSTPSSLSTPDLLGFRSTSLDTAYIGEDYSGVVAVTGGVAPYRVTLASGKLPEGLKFSGVGGASFTGVPVAAGTSKLRLEVVDANLSVRRQDFTLTVAPQPALDIEAALPPTEIRGETRIPLRVRGGRLVRALHYTWALPEGVKVLRVEAGSVLKEMAKAAPGIRNGMDKNVAAKNGAVKVAAQSSPIAGPVAAPVTVPNTSAPITPAKTPVAPVQPSLKWAQQGQQLTLDMTFTGPVSRKAPVALLTVAPAGRTSFTLTPPVLGKNSQIRGLDAAGVVIRDTFTEAAKPSLLKQGQAVGASASPKVVSPLLNSPLLNPDTTSPAPAAPAVIGQPVTAQPATTPPAPSTP